MKKVLLALTFAALSGRAYAQAPAQEPAQPQVQAPARQPADAPAGIRVDKMVTAASVENKEPVNEASSFDKTAVRVYTWTRITTTVIPVKIKHVYYADDKKVMEIALDVTANTYRVWSYKTVWPGSWRVEATDEAGKTLATAAFTVTDAAPAQTPEAETPTQGK